MQSLWCRPCCFQPIDFWLYCHNHRHWIAQLYPPDRETRSIWRTIEHQEHGGKWASSCHWSACFHFSNSVEVSEEVSISMYHVFEESLTRINWEILLTSSAMAGISWAAEPGEFLASSWWKKEGWLTSIANHNDVFLVKRRAWLPSGGMQDIAFEGINRWNVKLIGIHQAPHGRYKNLAFLVECFSSGKVLQLDTPTIGQVLPISRLPFCIWDNMPRHVESLRHVVEVFQDFCLWGEDLRELGVWCKG